MFPHGPVTIRNLESRDLERLRQLRNDPSTWMMLTSVGMIDEECQRRWFEMLATTEQRQYYAICNDEHDFIGVVRTDEIDRLNRSIRVGLDIVPELRGRGYGRHTLALVKKYAFDHLNMHRVWLAVLATNVRAAHLYEQVGFQVEGRYREAVFRDGVYVDYIIMSILATEYRPAGSGR
jgi:UDP-4-amino-4,6-dideoxy-N-acetyl-beta-L-altrosamine N-acetyltransferase